MAASLFLPVLLWNSSGKFGRQPCAIFFNFHYPGVADYATILFSAAVSGWTFWVAFIRFRRHSLVRLARHSERTSFFQRKKDDLALAIISAIFGMIIGVAGTKLSDRVFKADVSTGQVVPPTHN